MHRRFERLYLGAGLEPPGDDRLLARYYATLDISAIARLRYGAAFAQWLTTEFEPIDFVVRLAQERGVGEAVVEALCSGWLTTGPRVAQFERGFAEFCGAAHGVAVNSGTAALHAAMRAIGVGSGDEVIAPAITFAASANVAVYEGARPVFADVEADTLLIDPAAVAAAFSNSSRPTCPGDSRWAAIPDPITRAARNALPRNSAVSRRHSGTGALLTRSC